MLINQKLLFSKIQCDSIISYLKKNNKYWNANDRKYTSELIIYSAETDWIFCKLKSYFESITNLSLVNIKKEIHFHKYKEGDWFDKHTDVRDNRLYAIGVILNDDFNGGEFKLYNPNEITLNKIAGNCYIFDVRIEHEITPIFKGERYSLLWFLQNKHIKIPTNKLI